MKISGMELQTLDSCGMKRKGRDPAGEAEEARLPPRGKQVSGAKWNGIHHLTKTKKYAKPGDESGVS
jgi:hypothetical protein